MRKTNKDTTLKNMGVKLYYIIGTILIGSLAVYISYDFIWKIVGKDSIGMAFALQGMMIVGIISLFAVVHQMKKRDDKFGCCVMIHEGNKRRNTNEK